MSAEVIQPIDSHGRPLSPFDAETGVVLPILPVDDFQTAFGRSNNHHAHFEHSWFTDDPQIGENAVCYSRLQHGPTWLHRRYHRFYSGTQLPLDVHASFATTILNQVLIPEWAVDVSGENPQIVRPNERQLRYLQRPDTFRVESKPGRKAIIGSFLMSYALWQDLSEEETQLIERFISIRPRDARRDPEVRAHKERLAARLLGKSIETAVTPVTPPFRDAHLHGRLIDNTPPSPWLVVRRFVGGYLEDYFRTIELRYRLMQASQTIDGASFGINLAQSIYAGGGLVPK